jgi:hypothetical protein
LVKFIEDTHTYIVDGVIVPSVSEILKEVIFYDKYRDVPDFVLKQAAEFGTHVHHAIEHDDASALSWTESLVFDKWLLLKHDYNITPKVHECRIHYELEYAGTFDMIADVDGEDVLIDIKTTSKLDLEYLSWQLSMYAFAYGFKGALGVAWIPKRSKPQYQEIERKEDYQIIELLEQYYALKKHESELQLEW